jgi:hypothetical protein
VALAGSSGALAVVTSSGGLSVTVINPTTAVTVTNPTTAVTITNTTTAVSLSSAPSVVSASSGLVQVLSTGPYLVVSASSGVVQVLTSGTLVVVTASSGFLQPLPLTTGGISAFAYTASCSGNMVNVKGTPTVFWGFYALNTSQSIRYLRIYNTTSAPVVGVSTGVIIGHYGIPASTGTGGAGGQHIIEPYGVTASAGLGFNIGTNPSATDTGSSAGNDLVLTLYYV